MKAVTQVDAEFEIFYFVIYFKVRKKGENKSVFNRKLINNLGKIVLLNTTKTPKRQFALINIAILICFFHEKKGR